MFLLRVHSCNYRDLPQLIFPPKTELKDNYQMTMLCVCINFNFWTG